MGSQLCTCPIPIHIGLAPARTHPGPRHDDGMRRRRWTTSAAAAMVLVAALAAPHGVAAGAGVPPSVSAQVFTAPVPVRVVVPFRAPATRYGPGHRGVDLAAAVGDDVLAAGDGTVVFAGRVAGRGVVSIEHVGGLRTTYEPVTATVTSGERVARGQVIGRTEAGHAACAPASCLHFGARMPDRVYLDPMALLRPWQVRLKPWSTARSDPADA